MIYFVAALLFLNSTVAFSEEEKDLGIIRVTRDGAGPTHIFWLRGPTEPNNNLDVIGVVDPLFAAIRFFTVDRNNNESVSLKKRILGAGVCALPVDFRPWRIHQLKTEIHIEGVPESLNSRPNIAKTKEFETSVYVIKRDLVSAANRDRLNAAGSVIEKPDWTPSAAIQCGQMQPKGAVGRTASYSAHRGKKNPTRTIIIENKNTALSSTRTLIVRAKEGKFGLFSARELEPTATHRIVQITEAMQSADGMLRLFPKLLAFDASGKVTAEFAFDDTSVRSKLGHRPIAVMPSGELLSMGKADKLFKIQSCGIMKNTGGISGGLCAASTSDISARQNPDVGVVASSSPIQLTPEIIPSVKIETAGTVFARAAKFSTAEWRANTADLPTACRSVEGCAVSGQTTKFVALKGIRLTRGEYKQIGAPYAQTKTLEPVFEFLTKSGHRADSSATFSADLKGAFSTALKDVKLRETRGLPGNLDDDYVGDIGIDCSALVQIAWKGVKDGDEAPKTARLSTQVLQKYGSSYTCKHRLPNVAYLRAGDAIGLYVETGGAQHVVLFASSLQFDGASESWLVLESASACDGVCWSVYDPSFFNGWGLYRAANRKDLRCPFPLEQSEIKKKPIGEPHADWVKFYKNPDKH